MKQRHVVQRSIVARHVAQSFVPCAILCVGLTAAGCGKISWDWLRPFQGKSPHETGRSASTTARPAPRGTTPTARSVVHIAFDIMRIDIPVGSMRHSPKLWNHVDELRAGTDTASRLPRNGVRVGAGAPQAWPAIKAILDAAGAKSIQDQLLPQSGVPAVLTLGPIHGSETFFAYDQDNRLSGKTFRRGDKLIQIDYAVNADLGGSTDLKLTFEIRHDTGKMTWGERDGALAQVPDLQRYVFDELGTIITLKPGEFLMIGPGDGIENEYLLGARYFLRRQEGRSIETVLIIAPRPFQTDTAPARAARAKP